jgi:hypothetical protein
MVDAPRGWYARQTTSPTKHVHAHDTDRGIPHARYQVVAIALLCRFRGECERCDDLARIAQHQQRRCWNSHLMQHGQPKVE